MTFGTLSVTKNIGTNLTQLLASRADRVSLIISSDATPAANGSMFVYNDVAGLVILLRLNAGQMINMPYRDYGPCMQMGIWCSFSLANANVTAVETWKNP